MGNQVAKVKVSNNPRGVLIKKPSYLKGMENTFKTWTGIEDVEAEEALKDFTGDLYSEIRKLEALLCKEIEDRGLDEDFKEFAKARIRDTWRDIISHQKIGLDKLCIVIVKHLNKSNNEKKNK